MKGFNWSHVEEAFLVKRAKNDIAKNEVVFNMSLNRDVLASPQSD